MIFVYGGPNFDHFCIGESEEMYGGQNGKKYGGRQNAIVLYSLYTQKELCVFGSLVCIHSKYFFTQNVFQYIEKHLHFTSWHFF